MRLSQGSGMAQRTCSSSGRAALAPAAAPRAVAAAAAAPLQRSGSTASGLACAAAAAAAAAAASPSGSCQLAEQQQPWGRRQQQQSRRRARPSWLARDAAAAAAPAAPDGGGVLATVSVEEEPGPSAIGGDAAEVISYAIQMAITGETYEVHSWMLLLGILKQEGCTAAKALQAAGVDDLYGAWHEVLWALNVADGLVPRAFSAKVYWAPGAYKVVNGAVRFAGWAGRDKVASQDILMALAAAGALDRLFPDLGLTFEAVRAAVQKQSGERYRLPDDDPADSALKSQDMFL